MPLEVFVKQIKKKNHKIMSAEKRLQKILNKVNKGTGNTTEATDGREEISDALVSSGDSKKVIKGKRLYDKMIIKKNKNNN